MIIRNFKAKLVNNYPLVNSQSNQFPIINTNNCNNIIEKVDNEETSKNNSILCNEKINNKINNSIVNPPLFSMTQGFDVSINFVIIYL